jgi:hypothetical protein
VEVLDKITKSLLYRYNIPFQEWKDVTQCIAIGWIEGSKKSSDGGYLYQCCKYKVIDYLRKEFGWSRRVELDASMNEDGFTLLDTLCDVRPTPYQYLNAKEQLIVEADIDEQMKEYEAKHKPFGMLKLKML